VKSKNMEEEVKRTSLAQLSMITCRNFWSSSICGGDSDCKEQTVRLEMLGSTRYFFPFQNKNKYQISINPDYVLYIHVDIITFVVGYITNETHQAP
jgi:hypothetical protein